MSPHNMQMNELTDKLTDEQLEEILNKTWHNVTQAFELKRYVFLSLDNDTTIRVYPSEKHPNKCTVQMIHYRQKYLKFSKDTDIDRTTIKQAISEGYQKLFKKVQKLKAPTAPIDKQNIENLQSILKIA